MNPRLLFLLPLCVLFVQCGGPAYKDVKFESAKLATPGGHSLSEREYPFDEKGNYRKDWVKNGSTRKRPRQADAVLGSPSIASAPPQRVAPPQSTPPPAARPPVTSAPPQISPPPAPRPTPVPAPAPVAQARYHKVVSGDTLFGLSRKYSVSVSQLKSTNGLTSDTIRLGQTLRIP